MKRQAAARKRDAASLPFEQSVRGWEDAERAEAASKRSPLVFKVPLNRPVGTSDVGLTPCPNPVKELQARLEEAARKGAFDQAARFWPNGTPCPSSRTEAILAGDIKPGDHVPEYYQSADSRRKALPEGPGGVPSWKHTKR